MHKQYTEQAKKALELAEKISRKLKKLLSFFLSSCILVILSRKERTAVY